ncbi:hypothetical protein MOPEL_001_00630 [Mobilicoccus pelagius NBRC 104925]|uniref:N-acetyltransferase domain-containing protein n=2 Tax=Mobilicoccus TaxID=984996 RepID=H5UMI7_9MICO|nr:hypothetical protein MOPEL_001_00630 [Mobilicoccus pelagius NBRC 104925]
MHVDVKELDGPDDAEAATSLLAAVWGTPYESAPIPGDVVAAISAWGGSLLGAYVDGTLVGVAVGIAAAPHSDTLASLVTGVLPTAKGLGVGRALKEAQRRWAADRGVTGIEWTFDPLVRRNAHFNLVRLGADVVSYHVEHYPPIPDAINGGDPTDRLLARWDVRAATSRVALDPGAVLDAGAATVLDEGDDRRPRLHERPASGPWLLGTPADVETLRPADPAAALAWRETFREMFLDAIDTGRRVTGFTTTGAYVLTPDPTPRPTSDATGDAR